MIKYLKIYNPLRDCILKLSYSNINNNVFSLIAKIILYKDSQNNCYIIKEELEEELEIKLNINNSNKVIIINVINKSSLELIYVNHFVYESLNELNISLTNFKLQSKDINVNNINLSCSSLTDLVYYKELRPLLEDLINYVSFANTKIKSLPTDFSDFVTQETTIKDNDFDVKKIIGTDYNDYNNILWKELPNKLKRWNENTDSIYLESKSPRPTIEYYTNPEYRGNQQDPWSVSIINNNEAFITQGNHRTFISMVLYDLGLIQADMLKIGFTKDLTVDLKQLRKFIAIKKWLSIYYDHLNFKIEAKLSEVEKEISWNTTITKNSTFYRIILKKFYIKEKNKSIPIQDVCDIKDIDILIKHLKEKTEEEQKKISFKFRRFLKKINFLNKNKYS